MTPVYARHKRTTLAIATAVAAGALLTTGLATGTAAAQTPAETSGKATLAAAPLQLSPAARTTLIKQQQAGAADTAAEIGLGAKEKLVVKDVVKDADGTVHTRYERTYGGLPVLGGDLVVHESKSGATKGVSRATTKSIKVASLTPKLTVAKAEKQALTAAKAAGSEKTAADGARKVIWAGSGTPSSPTRPSSAASRTTAPRTSCTSSPTPPPARSSSSTRASRTPPAPARASTRARSAWRPPCRARRTS